MGRITWNTKKEAFSDKTAKSYKEFAYTSEQSVAQIEELLALNEEVVNASNEVIANLKTISDTFDEFTGFESYLSISRKNIETCILNTSNTINLLGEAMVTSIEKLVEKDETLISDLEKIKEILNKNDNSGSTEDTSGGTTGGSSGSNSGGTTGGSSSGQKETSTDAPKVYHHESSNTIANAAREMGFTKEQIDIAVGIARIETGNYKSNLCVNSNNFGGMKNSDGKWASYSTPEEGLNAYLTYLKTEYFDKGMNTPEAMHSTYRPNSDTWIKGVTDCME